MQKRMKERLFPEVDIKYVNAFNVALEKDNCCGNTRKYYLKTLRALLNKAIKEKEASPTTYPFGSGGFEQFGRRNSQEIPIIRGFGTFKRYSTR